METVTGYVEHIIFQNKENGYTVLNLVSEAGEITCVGMCRGIGEGESIEAQGEYGEHPMYGRQFKISACKTVAPRDRLSMERYLGSGAIRGVGQALAARIVACFGDDTLRILEQEPERLVQIKGISARKAREIGEQVEEKRDLRDALIYLQQFGISNALAIRIYNTYGTGLYGVLKENPYRLAEDVSGIGFRTADEIAARLGIHADSDYRIRSGTLYVLSQASGEGHCYLPAELLLERAGELLQVDPEDIRPQLANLTMDRKLVIKGDCVYSWHFYYAELECARRLMELNLSMREDPGQVREALDRILAQSHLQPDELQLRAVMGAICSGLFLLSGGPGTGKTTTINTMIRYFEGQGLDILLAAPTGRAAKRMTEATGFEARTIHRMLELNGDLSDEDRKSVRFERNQDNPLEADVIIIDEMSMVDLPLFQALLRAVVPGTRLILVGDVNQLPSVGPGQVLRDLIRSGAFPMVILQNIFRQARESDIVVNAHRVNRGERIELGTRSRDFFFLSRDYAEVIYKHMVLLIRDKLPSYVKADPLEIQVLTPMRKGSLGVETLNGVLQEHLNPPSPEKKEHISGSVTYREGDKVMQIRNNYQLEWEVLSSYGIPVDKGMGIFNGDMGRILEIREALSEMVVVFDEGRRVTYPFSLLEELELSYAVTIHKSQGSEYPAVILPLLGGPRLLLTRNLLYTGITRARKSVVILGSRDTVWSMIDNESENKRYTSLAVRIRELQGISEAQGEGSED